MSAGKLFASYGIFRFFQKRKTKTKSTPRKYNFLSLVEQEKCNNFHFQFRKKKLTKKINKS